MGNDLICIRRTKYSGYQWCSSRWVQPRPRLGVNSGTLWYIKEKVMNCTSLVVLEVNTARIHINYCHISRVRQTLLACNIIYMKYEGENIIYLTTTTIITTTIITTIIIHNINAIYWYYKEYNLFWMNCNSYDGKKGRKEAGEREEEDWGDGRREER